MISKRANSLLKQEKKRIKRYAVSVKKLTSYLTFLGALFSTSGVCRADLTVIIVDDEPLNRKVLENKLKLGFPALKKELQGEITLESFKSGEDVIDWYKSHADYAGKIIIFMDYEMPTKNGGETTREILQFAKEHHCKPPLIVPHSSEEEGNEIIHECGGCSPLMKPAKREDIVKVVRKLSLP